MIPTKPPPTFKDPDRWSKEFLDFVSKCLVKNPEERATATQLLQVSVLVRQPCCVLGSRELWGTVGSEPLVSRTSYSRFPPP